MSEEASNFSDDIVPAELPKHLPTSADTRKRGFLPWHKVRKQVIRNKQWNEAIVYRIKSYWRKHLKKEELVPTADLFGTTDASPEAATTVASAPQALNCLVIPGNDLLDVRSLCHAIKDEGCHIRFLGFNNSGGAGVNDVAENAVRALPMVRKNSLVLRDPFQSIGSDNSQAYHHLGRYGPYEVVNLDLCDMLVPGADKAATDRYYAAIRQLMKYQFEAQTHPWLFFITTHVDRAVADQEGLDRLAGSLRTNCDNHTVFAAELEKLVPKAAFTGSRRFDLDALTHDQLVESFGVVLGKWLIRLAESSRPQWMVTLLSSYRYTVEPVSGACMLSLAFEFKRRVTPPVDPAGYGSAPPPATGQKTELNLAIDLITSALYIKDPDAMMQADATLAAEMKEASADLMAEAGYERDAYLAWVDAGE